MRSDTKIRRLFAKYGLEGYGLYNLIIESIAERIDTTSPLPFLEETCDDIANFYNGNSAKIDEMVRFMVSEGLLEVENTEKRIACYKIYAYLEQSQTRSEKIRELITAYKDKCGIQGGHKCLGLSETKVIEENRKEKNRQEETRQKRDKKPFIPPTLEEVESYVKEKQLVINPLSFYTYYNNQDWIDSEGKKVLNWKSRANTWNTRDIGKGITKPFYTDKPKPVLAKPCTCGGQIVNGVCKVCGMLYDALGEPL
jgi:hypothetical protein